MLVGIIDADLIGRDNHRFPNLVCEKLSKYWKDKGATVKLLLDYDDLDNFDKVYISKVFTDTPFPEEIIEKSNASNGKISIGGTGFFFDKAPNLPDEIEHYMPDYNLYDEWIECEIEKAREAAALSGKPFKEAYFKTQFKEYQDYSIGFITRGCFRKCGFCVNKKYDHVFAHSPLNEFYDKSRKKICLLDDNFLGYPGWREALQILIDTGKPFKFKQGIDERLLTDEKARLLFSSNYDGDLTFAFDNVEDYDVIHEKLKIISKYAGRKNVKFYVLVGFESTDAKDIENAFLRIELLMKYGCVPYIMRYQDKNYTPWKDSKYSRVYIALARWCNQPHIFKKMSFRQFCYANQARIKTKGTLCSAMKGLLAFEEDNPEIAKRFFDIRFEEEDSRRNHNE